LYLINNVLGDHIGLTQIMGIVSPLGVHNSRFTDVHRDNIPNFEDDEAVGKRRSAADLSTLLELLDKLWIRGERTKAKKALLEHGWTDELSPFWSLTWFRKHFYERFGFCLLHQTSVMWKKHIQYLCYKYLNTHLWEVLNKRLTQCMSYPGILNLYGSCAVRKVSESATKGVVDQVKIATLVGDQMDALLQRLSICLYGLISDKDHDRVVTHLNFTKSLQA